MFHAKYKLSFSTEIKNQQYGWLWPPEDTKA